MFDYSYHSNGAQSTLSAQAFGLPADGPLRQFASQFERDDVIVFTYKKQHKWVTMRQAQN